MVGRPGVVAEYAFGRFVLDLKQRELLTDAGVVPLRPKVYGLLAYLIAHRDRVVPKEELFERLWPGVHVGDAALNTCVKAARQAVGDDGRSQAVIQTKHGHGYRFVARVEERVQDGATEAPGPAAADRPEADDDAVPSARDGRGRPILAVLPFGFADADTSDADLAEALTEDVVAALSIWRSVPVIAGDPGAAAKDGATDVRPIAARLGARYAVTGSLRADGDGRRLNINLVDAENGHRVWSERLDWQTADRFGLQDEVIGRIAATLVPELEQAEFRMSAAKDPEDFSAWDHYINGVGQLNQATVAGSGEARLSFMNAIALDPDYSEAYAGLAMTQLRDLLYENSEDREETLGDGFRAARRAVMLDHASSYAHVSLGSCYVWANQPDLAIAEFRKAITCCPSNPHASFSLGNQLDIVGESAQGLPLLESAVRLSPNNPRGHFHHCGLARAYITARRYGEARELLSRVIGWTPADPYANHLMAICCGHLGEAEAARAAAAACERAQPGFTAMRAKWALYRDAAANRHLFDGLRKVGLLPGETGPVAADGPASAADLADAERKTVTVLFADIEGSTSLIEGLDPEAALDRLSPALRAMIDAAHRYDGTVSGTHGDRIVALFGAPLAYEDHALRACYAALAMQAAVKALAGGGLAIRVGLHSGEVVVRSIGDEYSRRYEAAGPVMHVAHRAERRIDPGTIGITVETARQAQGLIAVRALGDGELFELVGRADSRTRWQVRAARGLTGLVGRDAELAKMDRALERAGNGRGEVVAIVGDAGMGKSRLVHECLQSDRARQCTVIGTTMTAYERETPSPAAVYLLRDWLGVGQLDAPPDLADRLRDRVAALDETLLEHLPALGSLLGLPSRDEAWLKIDPPARRRVTVEALKALFIRQSQIDPLIVVVEDLHWIDNDCQEFLNSLVDALAGARIFLLLTYRPDYRHDWAAKSYFRLIRADPLEPEAIERFLDNLLGDDPSSDGLRRLIAERTEGAPLFLEETVATLLENGTFKGRPGRYRLRKPADDFDIPATVQAVVAARIDSLTADAKRLLQVASVIGKDVPLSLLRQAAAFDDRLFETTIAELRAAEILYESRLPPEAEFSFKHALVHEVVYHGLLLSHRQSMHARLFGAIRARFPDQLDDWSESLARHAVAGELWAEAADFLRRAAEMAVRRSAHAQAIGYLEKALDVLENLPASAERDRRELDILLALGPNLMLTQGWGAAAAKNSYRRARKLAQSLDVTADRFAATWGAWLNEQFRPKPSSAKKLADDVMTIAETQSGTEFLLQAHHAVWTTGLYLGDVGEALDHARDGIELYDAARDHAQTFTYGGHDPGVCCHATGALCLWLLGQPDQGMEMAHRTVDLAQRLDHPPSLALAEWHVVRLHQYRREATLANEHAQRTSALCAEAGLARLAAECMIVQGWVEAAVGDPAAGVAQIEDGMKAWRAAGKHRERPYYHALLAMGHLYNGQPGPALRVIEGAADIVENTGERTWEAEILRLNGEILLARGAGNRSQAEEKFRRALAVAGAQNARALALRATTSLARLLIREGEEQGALELLAPVYDGFTEGFDTPDLEDAAALLEQLGHPVQDRGAAQAV